MSRSRARRWVPIGAIALAAAGAAGGVILSTMDNVEWAAVGAAVASVSSLVGTLWWEAARERNSTEAPRSTPPGVQPRRLRVAQNIGVLGRGSRLVGVSKSRAKRMDVRQEVDIAGRDSTIIGYQGDDVDS